MLLGISILLHLSSPVQMPPPLSCAEPLEDLAIPANAVNFATLPPPMISRIGKQRVAVVALFGVLARSIMETWPSMQRHIIAPLERAGYFVVLYIFNLNVDPALVDNTRVNDTEATTFIKAQRDFIVFESDTQEHVDEIIREHCLRMPSCKLRYDDEGAHGPGITLNAFRQMYSEDRVASYLLHHANDIDLVVVSGSDFYYVQDLSLIDASSANDASIYLTTMNEGEGFTNGFYMGKPVPVAKTMARFSDYKHYSHLQRDYERIVQAAVSHHGLERRVIDMPFCKIRANGVAWAGPNFPLQRLAQCNHRQN